MIISTGLGADLFGADREYRMAGEVEHLLGVVAYEPAGEGLFLFRHDDDEVGVDLVGVLEGGDGEVFASVDEFGDMLDLELVEEMFDLVDISVDEGADILRLRGVEAEEVYFGAEGLGHASCEGHLLACFGGAVEGDDDALERLVEVKILADREYRHGAVGDGAVGVFANPVFFEARHAVSADDDEKRLVFDGLAGQLFRDLAFADDVFQFDAFEEVGDASVAAFDFGADRSLVLAGLFDIDEAYVRLETVSDIDSQIDGIGRARGEVKTNDNIVHNDEFLRLIFGYKVTNIF